MWRLIFIFSWVAISGSGVCLAQSRAERTFLLADSLASTHNDRALKEYDKSFLLAQQENNYEIQFKSLYRKGIYYDITGKGDSAMICLRLATSTAASNKKWMDLAKAQNSTGVVEFRAGNYTSSLKHYFDALKWAEKAQDSTLIFKITNNIGHVYFYIDPERAMPYYKKNLAFSRVMQDSDAVADCYLNIANVYNELNRHDSALFHYKKSLDMNLGEAQLYTRANILQNMGTSEKNLGMLSDAENHLQESMSLFEQFGDKEGVAQSYVNLGSLFVLQKKWSKARAYFIQALQISKELNSKEGQRHSYLGLIDVESSTKNFQKAFEYSQNLSEVKDQLMNNEIAAAVAKMEAVYQNEKKQLQIENLNKETELKQEEIDRKSAEIKLKNFQTAFFGIAFIFIFILAGFILFAFIQKQKANRLLNEKNVVIQRSLEEKELLMKEIHHRAKNNLQVVSGLLSMQSLRISDEKSKDAMLEATNRVKSMALIHEQLYQPGAQTDLDVKTYLEELCNSLFSSYNLSENQIKLEKNIQDMKLDVDMMIPIGIIANELMSNALKHAFNDNQKGILSLTFSSNQENITLEVKDNGPGVPADFNYETARSFGMRLVHSLAKKVNAQISYINLNGTLVNVVIPTSKNFLS